MCSYNILTTPRRHGVTKLLPQPLGAAPVVHRDGRGVDLPLVGDRAVQRPPRDVCELPPPLMAKLHRYLGCTAPLERAARYSELLEGASLPGGCPCKNEIEKDLHRTFPNHRAFDEGSEVAPHTARDLPTT